MIISLIISLHIASMTFLSVKLRSLTQKNIENDVLHATFGHVVDEIQPTDSDVDHIGFLAQ